LTEARSQALEQIAQRRRAVQVQAEQAQRAQDYEQAVSQPAQAVLEGRQLARRAPSLSRLDGEAVPACA